MARLRLEKNNPARTQTATRRKTASSYARRAKRRGGDVSKTTLFLILPFCRKGAKMSLRRKTGLRGGKRPPRKKPDCLPARLPNDRDQLPASLLQEVLWVPTTTGPFRPGSRREAQSEKQRKKGGTRNDPRTTSRRSAPRMTTTPPDESWEGSQPKRPKRRGKPARKNTGGLPP